MQLFITTFQAVSMLLTIGILGFLIISRRILPENTMKFLSPLALDIALPCLVFTDIITHFKPDELPGWWKLPLWWMAFTLFAALLTSMSMMIARKAVRREFALSLLFQNVIFFPLAILSGLYGKGSPYIIDLYFFSLLFPSVFFSTYHLFFEHIDKKLEWKKIFNPVLGATLAAAAFRISGFDAHIPVFIINALAMVGAMAVPGLMLILGGNIYVDFKGKGHLYYLEIIKFVLIKNLAFPLITLAVLISIRPSYDIALMIILQSAVPPVTAIPIVVERAGGNRNIANQFMFSSFMVSPVSIPAMLAMFQSVFPG